MNFLGVIKEVGVKIADVAAWPFKHAAKLAHILHVTDSEIHAVEQQAPATKEALVTLVGKIEAMGPDALAAIAAKGFDIPDDLKLAADLKGLFSFVKDTVFPTIQSDYQAIKGAATSATETAATDPAPSQAASQPATSAEAQSGPGLHNVVPA